MVITNNKEVGDVIRRRISTATKAEKMTIAKKAGIQLRMLYRIRDGENTRLTTLLRVLKGCGIQMELKKSHSNGKN